MLSRATRSWMLVFTGCCLLISWLLSYSGFVYSLESEFYQQILTLAPSFQISAAVTVPTLSNGLLHLALLTVFALLLLEILLLSRDGPTLDFIILVFFSLLMLQILLAVLKQVWLPTVWPNLSFLVCAFVLYLWAHWGKLRLTLFPEPVCRISEIRKYIDSNDYNTAVLILKNCTFSDEMFELAYELGMKLEQEENWPLARVLYTWLVQFDPGMQDFIERIDQMSNPAMEQDLSLDEVTESRNQFGHFQLLGKKARGATATVYEAYDMQTHKRVALKILNQRLHDDTGERDIRSFLHEAIMVSHLDHPNIVKIHDADILGDCAYIAMDYIAGYPMSERLRRKKLLSAAESLRIMRSVLSALVLAQQKGIVHGDIKPANIMYDRKRRHYIITDFGAAYTHNPTLGGRESPAAEKKIIGTPAYMSPEQLSGGRTDGRSDLFSLAVTIYHLLSGKQPFSGEKLSDLKNSILTQPVDLDVLSVPDSIKQILGKALQKKPYQRFADASQMLHSVLYCQQQLLKKKA